MNKKSPLQSFLPFNHLDTNSFNMISLNRSYMILENSPDPLSNDLNPDSNFLTRLPTRKYMVEKGINDQRSSFNKKSMFSILHLNASSWLKNLLY